MADGITIRQLINKISFSVDHEGLKESESKFNEFKESASKIGEGIMKFAERVVEAGAAVFEFTNLVAHNADEVAKTARDIGIGGEALQEFRYGAKLAGIETQNLDQGLKLFTRNVGKVAEGTAGKNNPFSILGISVKDNQGKLKDQQELLLEVSDKMKGITDQSLKAAISMQLFGRSGIRMGQWLSQGREEIEKTSQEAINLGYVFSEDTLKAGEELTENIERMETVVKGLGKRLGAALFPVVNEVTSGLLNIFAQTDFISIIKKLAGGLGAILKGVFNALVPVFKLITPIMNILADVITKVTSFVDTAAVPMLNKFITRLIPIIEKIGTIIGENIIPAIIDIAKIMMPILESLFDLLFPILDMLMPIISIIMRVLGIVSKMILTQISMPLRIIITLLAQMFDKVSIVLVPVLNIIDAILSKISEIVTFVSEKVLGLFDLLIKGKFKEAFFFLIDSIKQAFFNVLNFFVDGANAVLKVLNTVLPHKIELIKRFNEDKNKSLNQITNNQNTKSNIINMNNQFDISGATGSPNDIKNAVNVAAQNVMNLQLKKLLISAGY